MDIELTNRLLAAMPSSLPAFYDMVRSLNPAMWSNLRQYSEPRMAAVGALQFVEQNPHVGVSPADFVCNIEAMKGR